MDVVRAPRRRGWGSKWVRYVVCILCWCDWWLLLDGYCWMAIVGWVVYGFWWSIQINSWVSLLLYLCIPQSRFVGWCDCHHLTSAKAFLGPGGPATVQDSVALVRRVRALVNRERDPMMDPCQIESVPNFLGKLPFIFIYLILFVGSKFIRHLCFEGIHSCPDHARVLCHVPCCLLFKRLKGQ